MEGWIKVHRAILDKPIWKDSTTEQKVILMTLLLMASHKENQWEFKGEKYAVQPGQFITSLPSIVEKAGIGISIQNVRTALKRFEKYEFLTCESTNKNRLITIVNWVNYQGDEGEPNRQTNRQLTGNQQAANSYQECKELNKEIKKEVEDNAHVKASDNSNLNADDPPADSGLDWLSQEVANISIENDYVRVCNFHQSNIGMLSPYLSQQLGKWVDDMNGEIVILAMEQALKNNVRKVSYINSILNDWYSQGARTLEQCQALINDFESRKGWGAHEKHQTSNKGVRHGGDSEESSGSKKESPFAFLDERYKKRWEPPEFLQVPKMQGRGGFSDPL